MLSSQSSTQWKAWKAFGLLWLCVFLLGCPSASIRREQRKQQQELQRLQKEVRQLRQMIQTIANRSSNEALRNQILLLKRQLHQLQSRSSSPSLRFSTGRRRVAATRRKIGQLVRSMMPLKDWLTRISKRPSPPLGRCRKRLSSAIKQQAGLHSIRCSASAGYSRYRKDCSGLVRCLYSRIGTDIFKSSTYRGPIGPIAMFHYFNKYGWIHRGRPRVGDAVFWHGTIDRDRDGRLDNDPLTHVGIVEKVDSDGRVQILHTGYGRRSDSHRIYMYRAEPSLYRKRRQPLHSSTGTSTDTTSLCAPRHKQKCRMARRLYKECVRLQKRARSRSRRRYFKKRCRWRLRRLKKRCPKARRRSRRKRSRYKIYNSYLVSKRTRKVALGYTTAELFAGFGSLRYCPLR